MDADALFRAGDAAEDVGEYDSARRSFEAGVALGDVLCLERLAYMFDVGLGCEVDKTFAMRCYQRAWRWGGENAANNIAILYRETGEWRAMFRWFRRAVERGNDGANVDLAKCYLAGRGVRRSPQLAIRCLSAAAAAVNLFEAERDEALAMLAQMRPRVVGD